jgi:hypothetical protein
VETLEPRQCLDEQAGLLQRGSVTRAHVEYAEFSWT